MPDSYERAMLDLEGLLAVIPREKVAVQWDAAVESSLPEGSAIVLIAISGHKRLATLQRYVQPSHAARRRPNGLSDPHRRGR